ncbi:MAG TPA: hypothetical protein VMW42_02885 [Desulfatiglandales bacterium]|nr:hypothetical protein [Desulfatiglandales bacterium]
MKKILDFGFLILTVLLLFMMTACATTSSVCTQIPEGETSVICEMLPTSPENTDLVIRLISFELVKNNVVAEGDVLKFLDGVEEVVNSVTTYKDVATYIVTKIASLRKKYGGELIILSDYVQIFGDIELPVSDFDRELLKTCIASKRSDLVLLF